MQMHLIKNGLQMLRNLSITLEQKSTRYILVQYWIYMTDELYPMRFAITIIMLLSLTLLTKQLPIIQMYIHYVIATEDFNIQTESFTTN